MTPKKVRKSVKKARGYAFKKALKIERQALSKGIAVNSLAVRIDRYGDTSVAEVFNFNPDFGGDWGSPDSYSKELGGFRALYQEVLLLHLKKVKVGVDIR